MEKVIQTIFDKFDNSQSHRIERKIKIPKYLSEFLRFEFLRNGFIKQYDDKIINSIYFDDKYSSFFKSNLDGDFLRIKPRLRWYGKDLLNVNHELKIKKGFVGLKIINKEILKNISQTEKIIEKCNEYHNKTFKLQLNVSSSIKYQRSYFIHPSRIRLTIDKKIFSKQVGVSNFINMPFEVIEFKYKPELDTFFREKIFTKFNRVSLRMTKCSKYSESMMI